MKSDFVKRVDEAEKKDPDLIIRHLKEYPEKFQALFDEAEEKVKKGLPNGVFDKREAHILAANGRLDLFVNIFRNIVVERIKLVSVRKGSENLTEKEVGNEIAALMSELFLSAENALSLLIGKEVQLDASNIINTGRKQMADIHVKVKKEMTH